MKTIEKLSNAIARRVSLDYPKNVRIQPKWIYEFLKDGKDIFYRQGELGLMYERFIEMNGYRDIAERLQKMDKSMNKDDIIRSLEVLELTFYSEICEYLYFNGYVNINPILIITNKNFTKNLGEKHLLTSIFAQ